MFVLEVRFADPPSSHASRAAAVTPEAPAVNPACACMRTACSKLRKLIGVQLSHRICSFAKSKRLRSKVQTGLQSLNGLIEVCKRQYGNDKYPRVCENAQEHPGLSLHDNIDQINTVFLFASELQSTCGNCQISDRYVNIIGQCLAAPESDNSILLFSDQCAHALRAQNQCCTCSPRACMRVE